ncbi:type IV pilin protein [Halomonas sp. JS92-SW72]|uniref:type IV pilin protein n=1 Tax=Halomonas sp. JS92-SW72 TaxID=2306583 RepID=UPI001F0895E4|nr:type IV pilin protein [Halomonas sp. JS92-SW72]
MTAAGDLERCYTRINDYEACFGDLNVSGRESENKFYIIIAPEEDDLEPYLYVLSAEPQGAQERDKDGCGTFTLTHRGERGAGADDCW